MAPYYFTIPRICHLLQNYEFEFPFFARSLLKRNPGQHPVLIMPPGVRFAELAYLVDFMYHGEVSILQDEIQSFMNLAELLKVKVGEL